MHRLNLIEDLAQDLRYAIRQLRKNPVFSATAMLMLTLGIWASVAIFAFVDAALIKPLPYRDPGRLVGVFETVEHCPYCNLSYLDYLDWKARNTVFSSLAAYQRSSLTLKTTEGVEPVRGGRVSDDFFRTLGVAPILGRDFYAGEDLPSKPRTVILSYGAWQRRFGGRSEVLGKTVDLDGDTHTIIGVLPRDFHFAPVAPAEFWMSLHAEGECDTRRSCHNLYGVGRLKGGVSLHSALAEVTLIAKQLEKRYPDTNMGQGAVLAPLTQVISGDLRPILMLLLGGAGLLLLIAAVNVSSLLLVRSESRKREMAVRTALGAARARIIRQFMTEGLVIVGMGSALGLTCASWAMHILITLIPAEMLAGMPFLQDLGLNIRVLAFAGAISLIAALLFSITPAVHTSLVETREGLAEGSRGSAGNTWRRLGSKLVVLELATAMVLLVGAGLLGKSLYRLLQVNIGFQPDHLATLLVDAPQHAYGKDEQAVALDRRVVSQIASLPGVKSVGLTTDIPVTHWGDTTWFRILGRPWHGEHNDTPERDVSPEYFRTLGAKLFRGRYFAEPDDQSKPRVVIINQALARQYFTGEDPIGKQLAFVSPNGKPMQIIGVVEDIKEGQLDTDNRPALYIPLNQSPANGFYIVVRTSQAAESMIPTLESAVHHIDAGIATMDGKTMDARIYNSQSAYWHRSSAWLVGGFAAIALLLSVLGLYGVVAYSVSQRTCEIGVRMALGARPGSIYHLILREAGWLTAIGVGIGLVGGIAGANLIRGLLFGVQAWDATTLGGVAAVLGVAALLASYLPARRAAAVNPVDALRAE